MNAKYLMLAAGFAAVGAATAGEASWSDWAVSTMTAGWTRPALAGDGAAEATLALDLSQTDQTMLGFGTALSELSWKSLSYLSESDRKAVLDELFGPDGARFTIVRTPIGSSDFALDYYSYDDVDGDFEMKSFSLEIDERALLPLLREVKARVPADEFRLWASPWCPPKWLKKNGLYSQRPNPFRGFTNDCPDWKDAVYIGEDAFSCDPAHYTAYATYFRKYVDAMKAKGFPLWMVMPQNEPNSAQPYPACTWTPATLTDFTVNYLAPALEGTGTEIFAGTIEECSMTRIHPYFATEKGRKAVTGAGFQWAGRGIIGCVHARYPDLFLMQTEHECNAGKNDWDELVHSWNVARGFLGQGAAAYDYWNLALAEDALSTWGWKQNSLVTVDRRTKTARFNPEYYFMKHLSHYVRKGAKRLKTCGELDELAFVNPDGSVVVAFCNTRDTPRAIDVTIGGERYRATLAPRSISTFVARGEPAS